MNVVVVYLALIAFVVNPFLYGSMIKKAARGDKIDTECVILSLLGVVLWVFFLDMVIG